VTEKAGLFNLFNNHYTNFGSTKKSVSLCDFKICTSDLVLVN